MFCSKCGRMIGSNACYCNYCGTYNAAVPGVQARVKRLMRPLADRKIAGVCSGVANYLELDTTLVRVLWLLCFFLGGTGLLAYVICWIAMPSE